MMEIIAWIVLLINALVGLLAFKEMLCNEKKEKRIINFIETILSIMTLYLCINVIFGL